MSDLAGTPKTVFFFTSQLILLLIMITETDFFFHIAAHFVVNSDH